MEKSNRNKSKRDIKRAATIIETAELTGVSTRSVRRIMESEQKNETVVMVFMEIEEGKNKLLSEVKKLVPFN